MDSGLLLRPLERIAGRLSFNPETAVGWLPQPQRILQTNQRKHRHDEPVKQRDDDVGLRDAEDVREFLPPLPETL